MFNLTRAILIVSLADMSANSIDCSVMGIGSRILGKVTGLVSRRSARRSHVHTRVRGKKPRYWYYGL